MSPEAWASSAVTYDCVSGSQAQPLLHSSFKEYEYVLHAQLAQVTKVLHTAVLLLVVANSHKAHAHSGLRHYVRDAALPWAFCVSPKRGM